MSVPTTAANVTAGGAIGAGLVGVPAATGAIGGDAALFQMLLASTGAPLAQGAAPVATMNQTNAAQPSASFATLLLQTQDAQSSTAPTPQTLSGDQAAVTDEAATPANLFPASLPSAESAAPTTQANSAPQTQDSAAQSAKPATAPQAESAVLALQTIAADGQAVAPQGQTTQNALAEGEAEALAQPTTPQQPQDKQASADPTLVPQAGAMTIAAAGMAAQQAKPQTAAKQTEETFENVSPFKAAKKTALGADKHGANGAATAQAQTNTAAPAKTAAAVIPAPALDNGETQTGAIASSISYRGADAARASAETAAAAPRAGIQSHAAMSLAQQIARRFDGQSTSFTMRMDPPELGRVDVQLRVGHDKRVTAKIGADSAATLTELRGAARELERALNEAGLDLAQDGLSFDLNDQRQGGNETFDAPFSNAGGAPGEAKGADPISLVARPFGMERWGASGVDVLA